MIKFLITNKMGWYHILNTHSLDKLWEIRVRPELTGKKPWSKRTLLTWRGNVWV